MKSFDLHITYSKANLIKIQSEVERLKKEILDDIISLIKELKVNYIKIHALSRLGYYVNFVILKNNKLLFVTKFKDNTPKLVHSLPFCDLIDEVYHQIIIESKNIHDSKRIAKQV